MRTPWLMAALIGMVVGGSVSAQAPVTITPANLKDSHKGEEVQVAGELVNVLPDRTHNTWLYVIRVAGTIPATLFHKEQAGAVDIYVTLNNDSDERKLLARWKEHQEVSATQKLLPPNLVQVSAKGENIHSGVSFSSPSFPGESSYKATLTQARLVSRPE